VVPVALKGTFTLMSRDSVDTGASKDRDDRLVTVRIGKPLYANRVLDDEQSVIDLRDRTRAAVVEMLSITTTSSQASGVPLDDGAEPRHG
jgi:hypothetical protein